MTVTSTSRSDPGGAHGPGRRTASIALSSVGALCALGFAPLAVIAILGALPPSSASADVSVGLIAGSALVAFGLSAFGIIGARYGRVGGSVALAVYGWVVGAVLLASAACLGAAAILHLTT